MRDEMLFVHEGTGVCRTIFGDLAYHPGDYLVLPIGTTWRLDPDAGLGAADALPRGAVGDRAAQALPQRLRPAPGALAVRPARPPRPGVPRAARRARRLRHRRPLDATGSRPTTTAHHPFDVVGWDGYLWPFPFDIADFQPITGRVHQPPPVHQTFQARNFVVCSFVPRKFDYHPLAIPAPYNHSNINSDEVIYYVAGNFMSRRGVDIASFTLHPAGIPHGPHPGTAEASIGKEATEELAVMVDTFHPLQLTQAAMDARRPELPVHLAAARGRRGARPRAVRARARRRSPTELAAAKPSLARVSRRGCRTPTGPVSGAVRPGDPRDVQRGHRGRRRVGRNDGGDVRPSHEAGVRQPAADRLDAVAGRPQVVVEDHARKYPGRTAVGSPELGACPVDRHDAIVARARTRTRG